MSGELSLHKEFFKAWEELEAIPKKKGAPSLERKAAAELLEQRAAAIRRFVPDAPVVAVSPEVQAFRALTGQIAAIPPQDTRVAEKRG